VLVGVGDAIGAETSALSGSFASRLLAISLAEGGAVGIALIGEGGGVIGLSAFAKNLLCGAAGSL
jgi:hypothetical protein